MTNSSDLLDPPPIASPQDRAENTVLPPTGPSPVEIGFTLRPARCAWFLGGCIATLVFCHLVTVIWHYEYAKLPWAFRGLFDLDEEESFGTWFSSGILLLAGLASALCGFRAQACGAPLRFQWWLLGAGFCLLSIDEIAGLHESVNTVTEFSWAIPGGILAAVVGLAFLPFLCRIPRRTAVWSVVAGAIYLGGAVGVELATEGYKDRDELNTLEYNLTTALEEGMEMAGVVIFLVAVLSYLSHQRQVRVGLGVSRTTPGA